MSYGMPMMYGSTSMGSLYAHERDTGRASTQQPMSVPAAYQAYPTTAAPATVAPSARTVGDLESGGAGYGPKRDILDEFTETSIRHAFLRRVFGLLTLCLLDAFGLCLAGNMIDSFRLWLLMNSWFPAVMALVMLVTSLVIICAPGASEKVPINYILLFFYATATGFMLSGIGAIYELKVISLAIGTTVAISLACMIFACQVKYDFTKWYPYLLVGLITLLVMGLIGWFVRVPWYQLLYGVLGTLLFSFLLVLDTQMVVGGKRKMQFNIDQYVLAVLTLFADIINIFLYVLRIFSAADQM